MDLSSRFKHTFHSSVVVAWLAQSKVNATDSGLHHTHHPNDYQPAFCSFRIEYISYVHLHQYMTKPGNKMDTITLCARSWGTLFMRAAVYAIWESGWHGHVVEMLDCYLTGCRFRFWSKHQHSLLPPPSACGGLSVQSVRWKTKALCVLKSLWQQKTALAKWCRTRNSTDVQDLSWLDSIILGAVSVPQGNQSKLPRGKNSHWLKQDFVGTTTVPIKDSKTCKIQDTRTHTAKYKIREHTQQLLIRLGIASKARSTLGGVVCR